MVNYCLLELPQISHGGLKMQSVVDCKSCNLNREKTGGVGCNQKLGGKGYKIATLGLEGCVV